jgi:hypothetical protein
LTKPVLFTPAARFELEEAHEWYERVLPGLGQRFVEQIDIQVKRIAAHPLRFPTMWRDIRRARIARFPYGLFFRSEADAHTVIACFHFSRDPAVWRNRVR